MKKYNATKNVADSFVDYLRGVRDEMMTDNFRKVPRDHAGGAALIIQEIQLKVPDIRDGEIEEIHDGDQIYVTKHFDKKWYDSWLTGYFRFGTTTAFRGVEGGTDRFSDVQEGNMHETYSNDTGIVESLALSDLGGELYISRSSMDTGHFVRRIITSNDYCACVSRGEYNPERARSFAKNDNSDLSAYCTYNLKKLKSALLEILTEMGLDNPMLICGKVIYDEKDQAWNIGHQFSHTRERKQAEFWLRTTFVKPERFSHEDEFRIVAYESGSLAGLSTDLPGLVIHDDRIRDAIVACGLID